MTESRPRRARGSLTQEVILDAAEQLAAGGFDALTMRAVAGALGAAPMALYNHYATKDELVDALLDRVLGRLSAGPPTADWQADLRVYMTGHRQVLADHPWAVTALFHHANPGVNAALIGEVLLEILDRGGIRGLDAVVAFSSLLAFNYGWSAFADARGGGDVPREVEVAAMREQLATLPVAVFPRTVSVAVPMSEYGSEEQYALALDRWIAGYSQSFLRKTR